MSLEKSGLLLAASVDLISYTTVEGVLYGFEFALYIFCARSLYLQLSEDRDRRRQYLFTLLYMSLVMVLALFEVAVDARDMQTSYVEHADYPGGGYGYTVDVFGFSPLAIAGLVVSAVLGFMMSGIQIWRLWVVWRASRYSFVVVALPTLTLLVYTGLQITETVMIAQSQLSHATRQLDELFFYGTIAFPLYISITVTVLITGRIFMVRRNHIKVMGRTEITSPYTTIISMLIESFALESVWLVILLTSVPSPTSTIAVYAVGNFFVDTLPFIQILAYLLVVYRVTTGRAWKEDTPEKLTTLQWNRDRLQTTQISTLASIPVTREEA